MKKFMFSALACVAFAFSGFASNGVVEDSYNSINSIVEDDAVSKPCSIVIYARNSKGRMEKIELNSEGNVSSDDCDNAKKTKVAELEKQSYKIERTTVTWG